MRSASERFRNAIGSTVRFVTEVEYSNDGASWHPLEFSSGSVVRSLSAQTHWTCSLVLANDDAVQPFNTRLRIRHGIWFGEGDTEMVPFGYYRLTSVERAARSGVMSVSGSSYESFVLQGRLLKPRRFRPATAQQTLEAIIYEVLFGASIEWKPGVDGDTPLPAVLGERDRWALCDGTRSDASIASAVSGRVIANAQGGFDVIPVPTLADAPVFTAYAGPGGVLVSKQVSLSSEAVYNAVVVSAENADNNTLIGPAVVADNDPDSPTYYLRNPLQGGYGITPRFYQSPLLTSFAQCERTARSLLSQYLGAQRSIDFGAMHHPLLEPGDTILIDDGESEPLKALLDSVTYDLTGKALVAETRTVRSRLSGEIVLVEDDAMEGGE